MMCRKGLFKNKQVKQQHFYHEFVTQPKLPNQEWQIFQIFSTNAHLQHLQGYKKKIDIVMWQIDKYGG